jgi:hypothetical protein
VQSFSWLCITSSDAEYGRISRIRGIPGQSEGREVTKEVTIAISLMNLSMEHGEWHSFYMVKCHLKGNKVVGILTIREPLSLLHAHIRHMQLTSCKSIAMTPSLQRS